MLIDNFDSFVHNLARYFVRLGVETKIVRNDSISVTEIESLQPQAMVLSPGPCSPAEAGVCLEVVHALHQRIPMLGVCLGHQAIAASLGGRIIRSPRPVHGRTSPIQHDGTGLFQHLPSPLDACRYHSLCVDAESLPDSLLATAWSTDDDCLMAIQHRSLPLFGLQFHPESVLTPSGYQLLANFLAAAGIPATSPVPDLFDERPVDPPDNDAGPPPLYY